MKKFSSLLLHSTYFVIDSDLLCKYAPPIEQTHFFQTAQIRQYKKYIQPRINLDKKQNKNNNTNSQNSLNNKKNFYNPNNNDKYQQEAKQLNEEQLDAEIEATKKRLHELYYQKKQRMLKNLKKNVDQKEKNYKPNKQDQAFYYDQFYYPENWYYYQNSNQNQAKKKLNKSYYQRQNWPQYERSTNHQELEEKSRRCYQSWYNNYD